MTNEHRNLKIFFLNRVITKVIIQFKESKNQLKLKKTHFKFLFRFYLEDILFKHKIKSNKGCLVDALAIRGDEGRERLR